MSLPTDPDLPPVPLTVVGGYLGAGKTTLLSRLLASGHGVRLAVIVNDVGEVGIDADLLGDMGTDGIVDLPNGCVCCSLSGELLDALRVLLNRSPRPEHIVIEASGVADPAVPAAWSTVEPLRPGGVIVCAAADQIDELMRSRYVGPEVRRQLASADLLALTKSDLVGTDRLAAVRDLLIDATGETAVVEVVDGELSPSLILDVLTDAPPATGSIDSDHRHDGSTGYRTWTWTSSGPLSRERLGAFLDALPAAVMRVKGPVRLEGETHRHHVQRVGRRHALTPLDGDTATGSTLVFVAVAALLDEEAAASLSP